MVNSDVKRVILLFQWSIQPAWHYPEAVCKRWNWPGGIQTNATGSGRNFRV